MWWAAVAAAAAAVMVGAVWLAQVTAYLVWG